MSNLNEYDIQFLIEKLQKGEPIPEDYKYKLFPIKQKEYELVYAGKMRKEDILANEDGVFPVPLQVEKVFNGEEYPSGNDEWRNMIVFGDNLQFLKTVYENKDPLIKDKVKGKVKLIYIDPPFGTGDEYDANRGQKAYSARAKGAEFVEFLRRRLILAREILADDGSIFVRMGYHFGHYIKVIMDEVFGKENFRNEFIVKRGAPKAGLIEQFEKIKSVGVFYDVLYWYSKNVNTLFNKILRQANKNQKVGKWSSFKKIYDRPTMRYEIEGINLKKGQWMWGKERAYQAVENYKKFLEITNRTKESLEEYWKRTGKCLEFVRRNGNSIQYWVSPRESVLVDNNWLDIKGYDHVTDYPTENAEELLARIMQITNSGDLVLDFFAGSGTTAAVAEKLGRRWIVCDIGKLAFYTMQKRILTIQDSKDLDNPNKKYGKKARSFITVNTGLYDLKKVFELKKDDYIKFVMNLFEVEPVDKRIAGIKIDGQKKDGYYCIIYPYWQFKEAAVDEEYLEDLHSHIGKKIGERLYIIAPANYVDFITDYHQIEKTRYYFLKVPYQIIRELHKVQFKKFRQPQSKRNVNDLEDAIGFHFIRQPDVETRILKKNGKLEIHITKFLSNYLEEETGNELSNFESLAMVLIDKDYDGSAFVMDEFYFAEDLIGKKKEETEEDIREDLKHKEKIIIPLQLEECGEKIMVVYIDIYGNEFKEVFTL
ncbi:MAG: site-specific DNA-methyltransferase [Thermodesulfovibrio sp.]|nr:site-specific DNA-methyltransferase [Thermodesulfovibrio sp.]